MKVGDQIRYDFIWTNGGDMGHGKVEHIGDDWIVIREEFYDSPVFFLGTASELEKLIMKPGEE